MRQHADMRCAATVMCAFVGFIRVQSCELPATDTTFTGRRAEEGNSGQSARAADIVGALCRMAARVSRVHEVQRPHRLQQVFLEALTPVVE
jgi:hypothetical protein